MRSIPPFHASTDVSRLLGHWAAQLGIAGAPARPIERCSSPPGRHADRAARALARLEPSAASRVRVSFHGTGCGFLDGWRIEVALLGLLLAARNGTPPADWISMAVRVGSADASFVVAGHAFPGRSVRLEDGSTLDPHRSLALALAARVADDHGGSLETEGSAREVVRIRLPLDPEQPGRCSTLLELPG